nr:MAG TPA: hypothetical protein [Bacteriophage sp.]
MQQNAFDATQAHVFTFNVYSGSQITGSKLTIKNNATLETVYDGTVTSYAFEHTVPANTLTNGVYYQASIQTMDAQGNFSPASNIIQFYCYSTPTLVFNNIPTANIIPSASFAFEVKYNQAEGEALDSYVFNLYTTAGTLISTSGRLYNTTTTVPTVFAYTFSGFNNGEDYVVEVNAVTVEGTQITTGKQTVFVQYSQPGMFSSLYLTNNCKNGNITVQANVIGINGEVVPSPPKYITRNEQVYLDLTNTHTSDTPPYVQWTEGYEIPDNYVIRIWGNLGAETLSTVSLFQVVNSYSSTVAVLENANGNCIEIGIKGEKSATSNISITPFLIVKQDKTDVHGYEITGAAYKMTSADTNKDMLLTMKCISNLYSVSLEAVSYATT